MLHTVLGHCDLGLWKLASILEKSYPQHICHIIWGSNLKFRVWMHLDVGDCSLFLLGHCDLECWPQLNKNRVRSLWQKLANLVCGYIFGSDVPPALFWSLWPWHLASVLVRLSTKHNCTLLEVGVQNLVCEYILGLLSVAKIEENVCPEMSNNFPQMFCNRPL